MKSATFITTGREGKMSTETEQPDEQRSEGEMVYQVVEEISDLAAWFEAQLPSPFDSDEGPF